MNTVCLCGSTRFVDQFHEANIELTKRGISVITIAMVVEPDKPGLKELLDLVHFNKILRADAVVVVGTGYIGHSTAREILWADMQDRMIFGVAEYAIDDPVDIWDRIVRDMRVEDPEPTALVRIALKRIMEST